MKKNIITDIEFLHQKSEPVNLESNFNDTIYDLCDSIPIDALGLAAPQIGIHQRIFIANLQTGIYIFVNPKLQCKDIVFPSKEACLSLPGVVKTIGRSPSVLISADKIFKKEFPELPVISADSLELNGVDAFIVQHEYDHLDGVLITDLKEYEIPKNVLHRQNKRIERISKSRKEHSQVKIQTNAKKDIKLSAKEKKKEYKKRKQERKILQIKERYLIAKQGLLEPNHPPL